MHLKTVLIVGLLALGTLTLVPAASAETCTQTYVTGTLYVLTCDDGGVAPSYVCVGGRPLGPCHT